MPGQEGLDGGLFVLLLGQALSTGGDLFVDGLALPNAARTDPDAKRTVRTAKRMPGITTCLLGYEPARATLFRALRQLMDQGTIAMEDYSLPGTVLTAFRKIRA